MEIVFRDNIWIYYIDSEELRTSFVTDISESIDLDSIPHLYDAEVLYHYVDILNNRRYIVYYEYNGKIITSLTGMFHYMLDINKNYRKDYTLNNIKLLNNI